MSFFWKQRFLIWKKTFSAWKMRDLNLFFRLVRSIFPQFLCDNFYLLSKFSFLSNNPGPHAAYICQIIIFKKIIIWVLLIHSSLNCFFNLANVFLWNTLLFIMSLLWLFSVRWDFCFSSKSSILQYLGLNLEIYRKNSTKCFFYSQWRIKLLLHNMAFKSPCLCFFHSFWAESWTLIYFSWEKIF